MKNKEWFLGVVIWEIAFKYIGYDFVKVILVVVIY